MSEAKLISIPMEMLERLRRIEEAAWAVAQLRWASRVPEEVHRARLAKIDALREALESE